MPFSRGAIGAGYTFCVRQIREAKDFWSHRGRGLEGAEGRRGRISAAPRAAGVDVERRRGRFEDPRVGLVEIGDVDVKVELLRVRAVWPLRRPEVRHSLEREHQAGFGVQGREVIADGPPGIRPVDLATEQRLVEPGESKSVGAVKNHALQRADHRCCLLWQATAPTTWSAVQTLAIRAG